MTTTTLPSDGAIVVAGDDRWDAARRAWDLTVDQRPAAVAFPRDVADVQAAVIHARERGLRLVAQSTGHHAAAHEPMDGALLLRTSGLGELSIDAQGRVARVGAGVLWDEVQRAAAPAGLAGLAGTAADVGVVGYLLGGGLGWFGRAHGIACNHVRAFDVVLADGTACRVDATQEADLFWALRGGGHAPAVVTAVEIDLLAVPEVQAGSLLWPAEHAEAVLHAWRAWVDTVPESVTSIGRVQRFPPLPSVPEPLRGGTFAAVEVCDCGGAGDTAARIADLCAGLPAPLGRVAALPPTRLPELHRDPVEPAPAAVVHGVLDDLPGEVIDGLVAATRTDAPVVTMDLRHLGGAIARGGADHGAQDKVDGAFLMSAVAIVAGPDAARTREALEGVRAAAAPWMRATAYANFASSPDEARRCCVADVRARLDAIAVRYDPDGLLH